MKKLRKMLVTILVIAAVALSMGSIVYAESTPVAKVGEVEYATVMEAIAAVEDGGTVELLAGEISEEIATGRISKSFTIVGAADYATVLTGGIRIGTDNSSWGVQEYTVTVKGITFKNVGLGVCDIRNVVVESNKFENTAGTAAIYIIDSSIDAVESNIVVKDNIIDGAQQGIRIRTGYNVKITGNTVKNTQHNAITLEHASKWPANSGVVVITDNTFENWALGGEGRVVRATFGPEAQLEKEIDFTGNKMLREEEPEEEYAKITPVGTTTVSLEKNYWNSDAPDFKTILKVEGKTEVEVTEYYKADTMKEEDLNTYVAPPVEDETEKEEEKVEDKEEEKVEDKGEASPETGDNSNLMLLFVLAFSSLIGLSISIFSVKKEHN